MKIKIIKKSSVSNFICRTLILFFISFALFSCRCRKHETVVIENEYAKSYFLFNNGSYWVYSDSVNQITDTLILSNFNSSIADADDHFQIFNKCYNTEGINYNLINTEKENAITVKATVVVKSKKDIRIALKYINNFTNYTDDYEATFAFSNELNSTEIFNNDPSLIKDSIIVNSVVYNNVIILNGKFYSVYLAKDIGIIKIILEERSYYNQKKIEYNLLKYKIITK